MDDMSQIQPAIEYVVQQTELNFSNEFFFNKNFVFNPKAFEIFCIICVDKDFFNEKRELIAIGIVQKIKLNYQRICMQEKIKVYPYIGFRFVPI